MVDNQHNISTATSLILEIIICNYCVSNIHLFCREEKLNFPEEVHIHKEVCILIAKFIVDAPIAELGWKIN